MDNPPTPSFAKSAAMVASMEAIAASRPACAGAGAGAGRATIALAMMASDSSRFISGLSHSQIDVGSEPIPHPKRGHGGQAAFDPRHEARAIARRVVLQVIVDL